MIKIRVQSLGLDQTTKSPVVILQEEEGPRVLPIWIGPAEASAIAMEMQGMKPQRPQTHDLLKQILIGLGGDLRRVVISAVKENTYFAELLIRRDDHVFQVDARPSDSIALALRMRAPIYTSIMAGVRVASSSTRVSPLSTACLDSTCNSSSRVGSQHRCFNDSDCR